MQGYGFGRGRDLHAQSARAAVGPAEQALTDNKKGSGRGAAPRVDTPRGRNLGRVSSNAIEPRDPEFVPVDKY